MPAGKATEKYILTITVILFKDAVHDGNPMQIQLIAPCGPLAVHSVCALKKTPVFILSSGLD